MSTNITFNDSIHFFIIHQFITCSTQIYFHILIITGFIWRKTWKAMIMITCIYFLRLLHIQCCENIFDPLLSFSGSVAWNSLNIFTRHVMIICHMSCDKLQVKQAALQCALGHQTLPNLVVKTWPDPLIRLVVVQSVQMVKDSPWWGSWEAWSGSSWCPDAWKKGRTVDITYSVRK